MRQFWLDHPVILIIALTVAAAGIAMGWWGRGGRR